MNQDFYTYIQRLHLYVQSQDKRIHGLEKKLKILSSELENVKSRPPVQVDKIEYKFDQLKVETLEGTLNIGLNPSDLEGIEELNIQNKGYPTNTSPKQVMERSMEIEDSINQYLDMDLEPMIKKYGEQLELEIEDSYVEFIREDIKKQLPQRIDYYLKQIPEKEHSPEARRKITERIEEQIKKDIENAVLTFLRNLPNVRKEDK